MSLYCRAKAAAHRPLRANAASSGARRRAAVRRKRRGEARALFIGPAFTTPTRRVTGGRPFTAYAPSRAGSFSSALVCQRLFGLRERHARAVGPAQAPGGRRTLSLRAQSDVPRGPDTTPWLELCHWLAFARVVRSRAGHRISPARCILRRAAAPPAVRRRMDGVCSIG